jgi:hypothetical protein
MRRILTFIFLVFFLVCSIDAQRRRTTSRGTSKRSTGTFRKNTREAPGEFKGTFNLTFLGPGLGYFYGDLGGSAEPKNMFGSTDWVIKETKTYWGLTGDVILPTNFGVRLGLNYGSFFAEDLRARNNGRMFSMNTKVLEGSIQAMFVVFGGPNDLGARSSVYLTIGAGYFYAWPAFDGDLSSRVQDPYRRIDFTSNFEFNTSIPFGIGYQYRLSDKWSIGLDAGYHYYLSDLVDGISTSYSRNNDLIFRSNLTVSYQIYGNECKSCSWSIAAKDRLRQR